MKVKAHLAQLTRQIPYFTENSRLLYYLAITGITTVKQLLLVFANFEPRNHRAKREEYHQGGVPQ